MNKWIVLFFSLLIFSSTFASNADSFYWLKAKANVNISQDGLEESYTTHIRFNYSDSLWMSFTGLMGIEGMRLLMIKDSLYIDNKLENEFSAYNLNQPNPIFPFMISFFDWKIILGNSDQKHIPTGFIESTEKNSYVFLDSSVQKTLIYSSNGAIQAYRVLHTQTGRGFLVDFSNFLKINELKKSWANTRIVRFLDNSPATEIKIDFKKTTFNQPQNMPFTIR